MTGRALGRAPDAMRPVRIEPGLSDYAEGAALISFGSTRVACTATVEPGVPRWRQGAGEGWVTAEYAMLPRATVQRSPRESVRGRLGGRTQEIQRLIGRSLRSAVDLRGLGELTVTVDCDVVQADGGTRTAAITGGWVALARALDTVVEEGLLPRVPTLQPLAAVSAGIVDGRALLDLDYEEDSRAQVDMNVVMAGPDRFVEVQGTAEGDAFSRQELDLLLGLASTGCAELFALQRDATKR